MAPEDYIKVLKQVEEFHKHYGELPFMPIRVSFYANGEKWEGYVPFMAFGRCPILGYPGGACACKDWVSKTIFLYDGRGRLFPGITEDICEKKPQREGGSN